MSGRVLIQADSSPVRRRPPPRDRDRPPAVADSVASGRRRVGSGRCAWSTEVVDGGGIGTSVVVGGGVHQSRMHARALGSGAPPDSRARASGVHRIRVHARGVHRTCASAVVGGVHRIRVHAGAPWSRGASTGFACTRERRGRASTGFACPRERRGRERPPDSRARAPTGVACTRERRGGVHRIRVPAGAPWSGRRPPLGGRGSGCRRGAARVRHGGRPPEPCRIACTPPPPRVHEARARRRRRTARANGPASRTRFSWTPGSGRSRGARVSVTRLSSTRLETRAPWTPGTARPDRRGRPRESWTPSATP